jgi:serine/threonine-protein kinase
MSPEQLRAPSEVDARSDIWSLAVMLCRMVSGVMPFEGESFADLCVAITRDPLPERVLSRMPSGLAERVQVALEKDPQRRYEDVAQFAAVLSQWRSGEESSAVGRIGRVLSRGAGPIATLDTWHDPAWSPPRRDAPIGEHDATVVSEHGMSAFAESAAFADSAGFAPVTRRRWWKLGALIGLAVVLGIGATAVVSALDDDAPATRANTDDARVSGDRPAPADPPEATIAVPAATVSAGTPAVTPDAGAAPPAEAGTAEKPRSHATRKTRRTPTRREPRVKPREPKVKPRDVYDERR